MKHRLLAATLVALLNSLAPSWSAVVTVWEGSQTISVGEHFQATITVGSDSWYPRLALREDESGYTKLEIFNGNLAYNTFDGSPEMWFLPDASANYLESFAPGTSIYGYSPMNTSNSLYAYASFDGPHGSWWDGSPRACGIFLFDSNYERRVASILLSLNTSVGGATLDRPVATIYRVEYQTTPFADLTVSGVPEPGSASLAILGLAVVLARSRRCRR